MKALYEKPLIEVIALEINDAIAGCAELQYFGSTEAENCECIDRDLVPDGGFTKESCLVEVPRVSEDCYFTAVKTNNFTS